MSYDVLFGCENECKRKRRQWSENEVVVQLQLFFKHLKKF